MTQLLLPATSMANLRIYLQPLFIIRLIVMFIGQTKTSTAKTEFLSELISTLVPALCMFIVRRGDEFHVIDEAYPKDTPAVVRHLQENYPYHIRGNLVVIPDAASVNAPRPTQQSQTCHC